MVVAGVVVVVVVVVLVVVVAIMELKMSTIFRRMPIIMGRLQSGADSGEEWILVKRTDRVSRTQYESFPHCFSIDDVNHLGCLKSKMKIIRH